VVEAPFKQWLPILMYHRITNEATFPGLAVTPRQFERQLAFLRRFGYTGLTMLELAEALAGKTSLPKRPVVITFDDGYADNYATAWPLLQKYGYKATIFLVSAFVGQTSSFDPVLPVEYQTSQMLTPSQILEMAQQGIEFGSHTHTHKALPQLEPALRLQELEQSRHTLAALLGHEVYSFAYPYSQVDAPSETDVETAGFRLAVAGKGPYFRAYRLNRIDPTATPPPVLAFKMSPAFHKLRKTKMYITARQLVYQLNHKLRHR
jgi:peptidoglycan/xylan/chitin deacetylase (PgdA/CDA1 family)